MFFILGWETTSSAQSLEGRSCWKFEGRGGVKQDRSAGLFCVFHQPQVTGKAYSTRVIFVRELHGERKSKRRRECIQESNNSNGRLLNPSQIGGREEMGVEVQAVGGRHPVGVGGPLRGWVKGLLEPAQFGECAGMKEVLAGEPGCLH